MFLCLFVLTINASRIIDYMFSLLFFRFPSPTPNHSHLMWFLLSLIECDCDIRHTHTHTLSLIRTYQWNTGWMKGKERKKKIWTTKQARTWQFNIVIWITNLVVNSSLYGKQRKEKRNKQKTKKKKRRKEERVTADDVVI